MTNRRPAAHMTQRRSLLLGGLASGSLFLLGCAPSGSNEPSGADGPTIAPKNASSASAMTVYRDPSCGCCESWARLAEQAGYRVTLLSDADMAAVKQRLDVPAELASCHTAVIGGLVIEGHVPFEHVARLVRDKPAGINGIAVPGMPRGSPGMETPDGSTDPFKVIAFDAAGKQTLFG
jgi:hypothetical protein